MICLTRAAEQVVTVGVPHAKSSDEFYESARGEKKHHQFYTFENLHIVTVSMISRIANCRTKHLTIAYIQ